MTVNIMHSPEIKNQIHDVNQTPSSSFNITKMHDHNENPALLTFNDNNPSTINNPTTTVNPIISSRGFSESSSGSHYSDEEYETWAKIDNELSTLDQASHSEENLFDPINQNNESSNDLRNKHLLITKSKKNDNLSASDIKQIKTRNQRKNAYVAKFELLKQEETGILQWLRLNIGKEPPDIVKNYKKGSNSVNDDTSFKNMEKNKIYSNPSAKITNTPQQQQRRHQASKSKSQIFFTSLNRHSSISKARSPIPPLNMPPPVMNDPTANAKTTNPPFSPSSSSSTKNNNKFATVISPKRRRFSFQAITSRLSVGSSAPISPFPKTIEENNNNDSSNSTIVVDEKALNKLCDVLPDAEREVLARYLRAVGGKDELLAVGLYMKDLKSNNET
ncbi:23955_t:CDS:2 [Entrophospora sp. SA101]|nr:23955_t:CDS:2 [Entrophospora sp. SA101]